MSDEINDSGEVREPSWLEVVARLADNPGRLKKIDEAIIRAESIGAPKKDNKMIGLPEHGDEARAENLRRARELVAGGRVVDLSQDNIERIAGVAIETLVDDKFVYLKNKKMKYDDWMGLVEMLTGENIADVPAHKDHEYALFAGKSELMDAKKLLLLGEEKGNVDNWFLMLERSNGEMRMLRMLDTGMTESNEVVKEMADYDPQMRRTIALSRAVKKRSNEVAVSVGD